MRPKHAMMQRSLPIAVALLALALPARAEPRKREAFEVAVDRAVKYLADAQNEDGSWTSGGFGVRRTATRVATPIVPSDPTKQPRRS